MVLFLNATKDNVCYANAVLAMLFNLPYIDNSIARLKALNPKQDTTTGLFVELYEKSKNIEKLSCKKLIESLGLFVIGEQQSSNEFFIFLFQKIENENGKKLVELLPENTVSLLYHGTCPNCSYNSLQPPQSTPIINITSFTTDNNTGELRHIEHLKAMVEHTFRPDQVFENYLCEQCKSRVDLKQRFEVNFEKAQSLFLSLDKGDDIGSFEFHNVNVDKIKIQEKFFIPWSYVVHSKPEVEKEDIKILKIIKMMVRRRKKVMVTIPV